MFSKEPTLFPAPLIVVNVREIKLYSLFLPFETHIQICDILYLVATLCFVVVDCYRNLSVGSLYWYSCVHVGDPCKFT